MTAAKNEPLLMSALLMLRLRCAADHRDAWLSGLWVLFRVKPRPGQKGAFELGRTDVDGYLCLQTAADQPPVPLVFVEKQPLELLLVRHPDPSVARQILDDASAGRVQPTAYEPVRENTAAPKKKPVQELVVRVPEEPGRFLPAGAARTGGWLLYRDMPNGACQPVRDAVRTVQLELGMMRYLVGPANHPYVPEELHTPPTKKKEAVQCEPPSAGVLDVRTWSSVLRFQRDAIAGTAAKHAGAPSPLEAWNGFDGALEARVERDGRLSRGYLGAQPAQAPKLAKPKADGIVDDATAALIEEWLRAGLRKPGHVLVGVPSEGGWGGYLWIRDDAVENIERWRKAARDLGLGCGIPLNHTYRDASADCVGTVPYGRARLSIHKTGFAFDLRMHEFVPSADFPVKLQRVDGWRRDRAGQAVPTTSWRLYAEVTPPPKVPEEFAHCLLPADAKIYPWAYDPHSPFGGSLLPDFTAAPGRRILDVTALGALFGFSPIHSFTDGWYRKGGINLTLSANSFDLYTSCLSAWLKQRRADDKGRTSSAGDAGDVDALERDLPQLSRWASVTAPLAPAPEVRFKPGVAAHDKLLQAVKAKCAGITLVVTDAQGKENLTAVTKNALFPEGPFTATPLTERAKNRSGQVVEIPEIRGQVIGLEWWHFQLNGMLTGTKWSALLDEIGWVPQALALQHPDAPFGEHGLGYTDKDLDGYADGVVPAKANGADAKAREKPPVAGENEPQAVQAPA